MHDATPDETPDETGGDPVVLHVIGKGRSGSTLLDMVLGQVPTVASLGEVWHLWDGLDGTYDCGCGRRLRECPVWGPAVQQVADELPWTTDVAATRRLVESGVAWGHLPMTLWTLATGRRGRGLDRFAALYASLYGAVADATGVKVLVDSSKWPSHPAALGLVPGIRPVVLHLVRDPRGTASSWRTRKVAATSRQPSLPVHGVVQSSLSWGVRHATTELLPYQQRGIEVVRMRYEDFVDDPAAALRPVLAAVGLDDADLGFLDGQTVSVSPTHTVAGNPDRFSTGSVQLRRDDRWHAQLPTTQRRVVDLLTGPLRRRYGYVE